MPKGYLLSAHRSPANPEKREAYLKLAGPAIEKAGGKVLASTKNVKAFEQIILGGKLQQDNNGRSLKI